MRDARDQAIEAGVKAALPEPRPAKEAMISRELHGVLFDVVEKAFDAAHKAGLITYSDEWEQVGWKHADDEGTFTVYPDGAYPAEPVFVRRCAECGGTGLVANGLPSNGPERCPACDPDTQETP